MRLTCVLALVAGLGLVGVAAAENQRLGDLDQKFVNAAASAGMAEVKAGDLAKERAMNDAVKKFADGMGTDHTKANKEFTDLLGKKGISVPKDLREEDRTAIDTLSRLKGADFDREYLKQQLAAHKVAVALFEEEAKNGKDADLRAFAEKALPTLREHLKHVTSLAGGERPSR
jgi:putative membrane protein